MRLQFDKSGRRFFFLTFCVRGRKAVLSRIVKKTERDGKPGYAVELTSAGEAMAALWCGIHARWPFLTASNVDPRARAAFVGLNASHSRREMARAVYEGIAFSHRYHLDRLMRSRPDRSGTIRLAGGAARSKVWTQMFADVMNMPVETVSADETGALGCCVAVAAALGDYKDAADAAAHMCRSAGRVLPRADAARVYEEKYALYLKTIECLNALWPDMQRFMEEHHA